MNYKAKELDIDYCCELISDTLEFYNIGECLTSDQIKTLAGNEFSIKDLKEFASILKTPIDTPINKNAVLIYLKRYNMDILASNDTHVYNSPCDFIYDYLSENYSKEVQDFFYNNIYEIINIDTLMEYFIHSNNNDYYLTNEYEVIEIKNDIIEL